MDFLFWMLILASGLLILIGIFFTFASIRRSIGQKGDSEKKSGWEALCGTNAQNLEILLSETFVKSWRLKVFIWLRPRRTVTSLESLCEKRRGTGGPYFKNRFSKTQRKIGTLARVCLAWTPPYWKKFFFELKDRKEIFCNPLSWQKAKKSKIFLEVMAGKTRERKLSGKSGLRKMTPS